MLRPKIFKNIGLVVIGLLIAIVASELSLRALFFLGEGQLLGLKPLRTTITWQEDPEIGEVLLSPSTSGWMVTPSREYYNFIEGNKEGFFDTDHSVEKPNGVYRIILLGDSFVASLQTPKDQTIGKVLEKNLNDSNLGKKVEVISMGMGNTGTAQQYIALQKIGIKYQPDLVVHMFLTANDLKNNWPTLQNDPYRPYLIFKNNTLTELPHIHKSGQKLYKIKEAFKSLRLVELALSARQRFWEYISNKEADYPTDYHVYDLNYNSEYQKSWNTTQKLLEETKKISEDSGSKYFLAILANNEQVNQDIWTQLGKNYPALVNNADLNMPDILLKSFCDQEKLDCLFMLPSFRNFVNKNPRTITHYPFDGHWNQTGTNLAAQILAERIKTITNSTTSQ